LWVAHCRAMSLCGLVMARVQARELDGACRTATEAATLNRPPRLRTRPRQTHRIPPRHQPHATATPVKDFDAKFADLLRPTWAMH
jgi:hypothetical protein